MGRTLVGKTRATYLPCRWRRVGPVSSRCTSPRLYRRTPGGVRTLCPRQIPPAKQTHREYFSSAVKGEQRHSKHQLNVNTCRCKQKKSWWTCCVFFFSCFSPNKHINCRSHSFEIFKQVRGNFCQYVLSKTSILTRRAQ